MKQKEHKETMAIIGGEFIAPCHVFVKKVFDMTKKSTIIRVKRSFKSMLPKGAIINFFEFGYTDSDNITHAVAYYRVELQVPQRKLGRLLISGLLTAHFPKSRGERT